MADLQRALEIAVEAHRGESDRLVRGRQESEEEKGTSPYVLHPIRMMLNLEAVEERIAAVLHDVVEDTDWTLGRLREEAFSSEIVDAVDALTSRKGESYDDFIDRVAQNPIALRVKIADIEDNMNLRRIENPTEKDWARLEKYRRCWATLRRASGRPVL